MDFKFNYPERPRFGARHDHMQYEQFPRPLECTLVRCVELVRLCFEKNYSILLYSIEEICMDLLHVPDTIDFRDSETSVPELKL